MQASAVSGNVADVKVNVTKQDILEGKPGNKRLCPVARAVRNAGGKKVVVYHGCTFCNGSYYHNSATVTRFIEVFDATTTAKERAALRPFSFTLALR